MAQHITPPHSLRKSNLEALRIIAMSLIVIHHFFVHGLRPDAIPSWIILLIGPLIGCGVNLFFLISGWFGIKLRLKSVVNLVIVVFGFSIFNVILTYLTGHHISVYNLIQRFIFPVSQAGYWFMSVYLMLLLISPIINYALENMPIQSLRKGILIFSIATFYTCWLGRNMSNYNGYSFLQGAYIYCLGYYMHRDNQFIKRWMRTHSLWIAILTFALAGIIQIVVGRPILSLYSSPFMVVGAAALFLWFTTLKFQSRVVNSIATAALGCYLLQDGLFGREFMYGWLQTHQQLWIYAAVFVGTWLVSWPLTRLFSAMASAAMGLAPRTTCSGTPDGV